MQAVMISTSGLDAHIMVARSQLLHVLIAQIEFGKVSSLASLRPYENTAIVATFEVSFALDGSIVLAGWLVERDSDPDADSRDLWHCANIGHRASASV